MTGRAGIRKHSFAVWLLIGGGSFFMAAGAARMVYSIINWYWLNFAGVRPGPLYLVISGMVWSLVGLAAFVWLLFCLPGYRWVGSGACIFFALTYWLDRLLVRVPQDDPGNTGFALMVTLFISTFVLLVLRPWLGWPGRKG